jgi:hypothetical protein
MKYFFRVLVLMSVLSIPHISQADQSTRILVKMPERMQDHMLTNMRDHLSAIHEILQHMNSGDLEKASEVAEFRLGMSAMSSHGAKHMGKVMPEGMRKIGRRMHKTASRFARAAEEGDGVSAYQALTEVTSSCVACHGAYRIR